MPESRGLLRCQGQWKFDDVLLLLTKPWIRLEFMFSGLEFQNRGLETETRELKVGARELKFGTRDLQVGARGVCYTAVCASSRSASIFHVELGTGMIMDDDSRTTSISPPHYPSPHHQDCGNGPGTHTLESKQRSIHASKPAQDNSSLPANPSIASANMYMPPKGPVNNAALTTTTANRKCNKLPSPTPKTGT